MVESINRVWKELVKKDLSNLSIVDIPSLAVKPTFHQISQKQSSVDLGRIIDDLIIYK